MVSNIYRFGHGSYTMADQQMAADAASNGYCLDALLFLSDFETWPSDSGGYVSYIAVEDPNEVGFVSSVLLFLFPILKVPPRPNCLAVVFREPEILSFTKYINVLAGSNFYYLLNCSFFGAASDGESESEDSLDSTSEDFEDDFEFEGEIVIYLIFLIKQVGLFSGRRRAAVGHCEQIRKPEDLSFIIVFLFIL